MNSNRNIIFVYNAKGGKWNYILDTVHKYASPSTYECNLCKITHDLKMKEAWKKFIESSPHNFKFLHSEELEEYNLTNYKNDLPICVEENSGEYKILINKDQMNKYKDEFDLINIELPLEYKLDLVIFSNSFKFLLNSPTTPINKSLS